MDNLDEIDIKTLRSLTQPSKGEQHTVQEPGSEIKELYSQEEDSDYKQEDEYEVGVHIMIEEQPTQVATTQEPLAARQ